jgi:ribokinase
VLVPKVIVIGSINMDIVASTARHPVPGETVIGASLQFLPGGKGANQAIAAARAGADTALVANVGADRFASELTAFLERDGVDIAAVHEVADAPTGIALVVVDGRGENTIVVISGANGQLDPVAVDRLRVEPGDIVVAQFEVPVSTVTAGFARARDHGATTILNAAPAQPMSRELGELVDLLVINESELNALAGTTITPDSSVRDIQSAMSVLRRPTGSATVLTLGPRGAVAAIDGRMIDVAGRAVRALDSTGAGDCFVGALAARLASGGALEPALEFANIAASICVERTGAGPAMPTLAEVEERSS